MAREDVAPRWRRAANSNDARANEQRNPSLVDSAEEALHIWLAGGRYRQDDRLPPEHEVATMLGVSRGTLRSALRRLEDRGARRVGIGQDPEQVSWVVMADPEGNEFCVLSARE